MARLWVLWMIALSVISGISADETIVDDYPLVETLRQTPVRVFDPVLFAQQVFDIAADTSINLVRLDEVGAIRSFWITNNNTLETTLIDAELRVRGEHALIWVEVGGNIADEHLEAVGVEFDEKIYPQSHALWGDVSELQHPIDILYARNLGNSVAGYFTQRHTYPDEVVSMSNERPMFFINLDVYRHDLATTGATLGHEYQHMIRFYLKPYEDTWLNEGLSTFSEYYLGYPSASRYIRGLRSEPHTQLNTFGLSASNRMVNYSAGFLFVMYFYHQYGVEGVQTLSHQSASGLDGVMQALAILDPERSLDEFFADWVLANYLFEDEQYGYGGLLSFPDNNAIREMSLINPFEFIDPQYSTRYFNFRLPDNVEHEFILSLSTVTQLIPTDAPSGDYIWYSNRGDISTMTLTRAFDLRTTKHASLTFDMWYEIEEFWDFVYLLVSVDDGETWDFLYSDQMVFDNPSGNNYGAGYTGYSDGWQAEAISLDAYAGQEIVIRFQYITDDAVTEHGIALDNIAIPEIGYFSDLETDDGGWLADGWVWMDNRLPQKAWVQAIIYDETDQHIIDIKRWLYPDEIAMDWGNMGEAGRIVVAVSPFAPVTTVPATLNISLLPKN